MVFHPTFCKTHDSVCNAGASGFRGRAHAEAAHGIERMEEITQAATAQRRRWGATELVFSNVTTRLGTADTHVAETCCRATATSFHKSSC